MSVRLGLLALLDQADMYGYQLKTRFEAQTGGIWLLNIGQVYSTLERLERDGLVTTTQPPGASGRSGSSTDPDASGRSGRSGGREQKYYAITRAGRDELAGWFAAGLPDAPPPRDELVAKVLFALAGGRDHALAVITRQRTALTAALQTRRRAQRASHGDGDGGRQGQAAGGTGDEDHAGGASAASAASAVDAAPSSPAANGVAALSTQLVTDALVARAEADLRWLDLCEARVRLLASGATAATGATGPAGATGPTST